MSSKDTLGDDFQALRAIVFGDRDPPPASWPISGVAAAWEALKGGANPAGLSDE